MTRKYDKYICQLKHNVLQEYRPGIYSYELKALAKRFKIKDGHKLIMSWYRQWDGDVDSLKPTSKGCRSRTMTRKQVRHHILEFVESMNNKHVAVDYNVVQAHIESVLKRRVPIRTIRRYAENSFWENIGRFRRSLQRINNDRLIFIDETAMYSIIIHHKTLVTPGEQPLILVAQPSAYAKRYDFVGAINGSQSIAYMTLTPEDRNN
ncbi:unnamed protein product [Rotaria sordida]|uniref:Transposase n=1 Tax=Rotaria sordida TaxID=392033 RepID=A0A819SIX6_9BILA|nr:unnamed protein product [Rotaria sordida]CAF4071396.1 unnamed protein product [Rotaria sordida]